MFPFESVATAVIVFVPVVRAILAVKLLPERDALIPFTLTDVTGLMDVTVPLTTIGDELPTAPSEGEVMATFNVAVAVKFMELLAPPPGAGLTTFTG